MKITIQDGGYGWALMRRALNTAEGFAEYHAGREAGQRNCVIYASTDPTEPMAIIWWTADRNITVRIEDQPDVEEG